MTSDLAALFRLAPERRSAPRQFAADPQALARWLEQLPKTDLGQSTRALYQAAIELNQVALAPGLRLELLELLRPAIRFAGKGLQRHYLNQPLVLPGQADKVARLAQALTSELAQGYTKVALAVEADSGAAESADTEQTLATALHRALVETSRNLLRDFQLYREPQPRCWRMLHELAALSRRARVQHVVVTDPQDGDCPVESAYKRALLLASAGTYQLRQEQLAQLFAQLASWARFTQLGPAGDGSLLVDPHSDRGPVYRDHVDGPVAREWLGIETRKLARHLTVLAEPPTEQGTTPAPPLTDEALQLIAQGWRLPTKRGFERRPGAGAVEVCLGLTATHHFLGGAVDFNLLLDPRSHEWLGGARANPFLKGLAPQGTEPRFGDIWDSAYRQHTAPRHIVETVDYQVRTNYEPLAPAKYECHAMSIIDTSLGGCRLQWVDQCGSRPGNKAPRIKTGEIIGIRDPDHKMLRIGAVRWVRILQSGPQLGAELLSPAATAYGARVLSKMGPPGDYLRVLVLPAMDGIGRPETLIAPRLPFRAGQSIQLVLAGEETLIELTRRIQATAAFSQFAFRRLSHQPESEPQTQNVIGDGFDTLWDML